MNPQTESFPARSREKIATIGSVEWCTYEIHAKVHE